MRKNLPPIDLFIGKKIERFPNYVIREHIASGNNGHVFRAHNDSTDSNLAYKIVPKENVRSMEYLDEAKRANLLENQSVVRYFDMAEDEICGIKCVVFICDYVKGTNLRDYIRKSRSHIDVRFIESYLRSMFALLYELKRRGIVHGDLHAGNILVSRSDYDIYERVVFRVTDFGVGQMTGSSTHANDFLFVADILRELLECVVYQDCDGRDRFIYDVLRLEFLRRHLVETNALADDLAMNPQGMLERLDSLNDEYRRQSQRETASKMVTPFDFPNCEQIGNHHLLLMALYSDRLLGLNDVQARANLVLTGPRGCGKTTVFRALSLDYLISTENDSPTNIQYIGVYYRCDDLYFAFPRYDLVDRDEALNLPMQFLTATLLASALEQLANWANRHFSTEFSEKEGRLVDNLWKIVDIQPPNSPIADKIVGFVGRLKKERRRAATKQRFVNDPKQPIRGYFGPEIFLQACEYVRNSLSFLENRPFYFFIDDYSHPKITMDLQRNLNRLLMTRTADVFFKLSTESPVSFARDDIDNKRFVETREYDLLNVGLRYLTDTSKRRRSFIEDLFKRRFKEVKDYPVTSLDELFGSSSRNENAVALAIRDGRRDQQYYAGIETIVAMCSGDIHYIIRLVSRMVEDSGGAEWLSRAGGVPKIDSRRQNNSIRAAAGTFVESVHKLPKWGPQLAQIVTAFGNVAHSYIKFETSSNSSDKPPHQASRIEPYEALRLSSDSREILEELLRYSIFIEDPRGKSRRGEIVPRFYLRRYLIPHLRLTFSSRDSLELENADIELLLSSPREFEKSARLKSLKDAQRRRRKRVHADPNQRILWED